VGLPVRVVTYRGQTGNIHRYDPAAYLTHLNPRVDCVVCVADAVRLDLIANGLPASRAVTIYKGHDLGWYQAPPASLGELGIDPSSMLVGLVANARPRKGVPLFLRALRHLPDDVCCDVLLVGAGMEVYRDSVAGLPRQVRVHFLGYRTDAAEVIAACRVSVLPALRREGLPKATIEAMAYGVTPLVTRTGGNAELVVDGESGLVVEPGDEAALADALTWLYRNPARCAEMGRAARARIDRHFNIRDTVRRTFDLYQSLLG
jgi:glycosyltransferase involved in cell wall biosynthesis